MPTYAVFGRRLASDTVLPELPPAIGAADLTFECAPLDDGGEGWFDIWPWLDGRSWIIAKRYPHGYRVRYEGRVDFFIDPNRAVITADVLDCPVSRLRHFLLDQIIPLYLSLDHPVLHASSVLLDAREAVAFIGPGGTGKSTIAASLGALGHQIGADDGLLMRDDGGTLLGVPAYPGVRLLADSAQVLMPGAASEPGSPKRRLREGLPFFTGAVPLTQLFVLTPADAAAGAGVQMTRLSPCETVMALIGQSYRLALDDRRRMAGEFERLTRAAARLSAWQLVFPRDLARAPDLARRIADHVLRHAAAIA